MPNYLINFDSNQKSFPLNVGICTIFCGSNAQNLILKSEKKRCQTWWLELNTLWNIPNVISIPLGYSELWPNFLSRQQIFPFTSVSNAIDRCLSLCSVSHFSNLIPFRVTSLKLSLVFVHSISSFFASIYFLVVTVAVAIAAVFCCCCIRKRLQHF